MIRDYLTVHAGDRSGGARAGPHAAGERGRGAQPDSPVQRLVYVTLQELATRIAHRNTGKLARRPRGYEVMARVAADENLHYLFYRDLASGGARARPVRRW